MKIILYHIFTDVSHGNNDMDSYPEYSRPGGLGRKPEQQQFEN
jgi:hypothetical protein